MKKKNLKLVRGDDVSFKLTFTTDAGEPIDLTNTKLNLHARNSKDELVLTLSSVENTITRIDANSVVVKFPHELTQDLKIEPLKYDLQLLYDTGSRKTVLYGEISLIEDQTRI